MRFSPTSRHAPPPCDASLVSEKLMLRPHRDPLSQRPRQRAQRPPRSQGRRPARERDDTPQRHAADRLRQRGPRRPRGRTALRGDLHGRPGHGVVHSARARGPLAPRAHGGHRSAGWRWRASRRSTRAGGWIPTATSRWRADRAGR